MSMNHVQYGGTPYSNNYNFRWDHSPSLSWEASHHTLHSPQFQGLSLEETMAELRRAQDEFSMAQAESEGSMAVMDNAQVGFPRFHAQNEMSPPPQEKMTNLEAIMAKWRRVRVKLAKSRNELFMEETKANVQFQSLPLKSLEETILHKPLLILNL